MIGGLIVLLGSLSVGCLVVALWMQTMEVRRLRAALARSLRETVQARRNTH